MEPITRHLKTRLSIELNLEDIPEDQYDSTLRAIQHRANRMVEAFNLQTHFGFVNSYPDDGLDLHNWTETVAAGRTRLGYWEWVAHRRSILAMQGEG
jgi:hypothetical protein